jgi:trimethylamine--corrinoid protein Co-methyltransferase
VGYAESGKTTSPELIVLCSEIISMLRRFMAGISFDEDALAMNAIQQVGTDRDYLSTQHTLDHFRGLWRPKYFNRLGGEIWAEKGSLRTGEIIRQKTLDIIRSHRPEPLPDPVTAEIEYVLKQV